MPGEPTGMVTDVSIAFGEIRHRRLRPANHAFRYPGFFVRLPMHALPPGPCGSWLFGVDRPALMSFRRTDHGDGRPSALQWLRGTLAEHGIDADGQIWLHTFPRVFGYAFKPVSFWFCHRADGALSAIVAEVNNTFGERHCYLLAWPDARPIGQGQELVAAKAFHVSPFCQVTGSYRFRFFNRDGRSLARVDHHDDQGPVLLTSISGRLEPLTQRACARALLAYPVFTLGVILRIHWQALKLFAKRVPFFGKPAPPQPFVSRGSP